MPVHDWTKVDAGTFHSFHNAWITHLVGMLNDGVLPQGFYALSEPHSSRLIPGTRPSVPADLTLTIRRAGGRRIVAFLQILSTGTRDSESGIQELANRIDAALVRGIHAMDIDLFPPGRFDPQGLHGLVWARYGDEGCVIPHAQPLTVSSYRALAPIEAYIEPMAFGDPLPDMPLFLDTETYYVCIPLEPSYQTAFQAMPAFLRQQLEERRTAT